MPEVLSSRAISPAIAKKLGLMKSAQGKRIGFGMHYRQILTDLTSPYERENLPPTLSEEVDVAVEQILKAHDALGGGYDVSDFRYAAFELAFHELKKRLYLKGL